jgi:hypothetical protein
MANRLANRADRVVRTRLREPVHFQTLTENRTIRLSSVLEYTGRSHFGPWHRILSGTHDFQNPQGIFTPLVFVEVESADIACDPNFRVDVRGESWLGHSRDRGGALRNIVREGRHQVSDRSGKVLARARMLNVFTRYDPDPARRRVTELPAELGLGPLPSRMIEVPGIESLIDPARKPDFADAEIHVWHYGQTDPNRHVNGTAYLRAMEEFIADSLYRAGQNLRRLYAARARIVYRRPSFRGEGYRRVAWYRSEAPLVIAGAFYNEKQAVDAQPAVAIELTLLQQREQPAS